MATRDYAARNPRGGSGGRRPPAKKKSSLVPGWGMLLLGLSIGVLITVFVYVSRPTQEPLRGTSAASDRPRAAGKNARKGESEPAEMADAEDTRSGKPALRAAQPGAKGQADADGRVQVPPKEKSRFTFYELLPSQEVLVPSQPAGKATPPPPLPASTTPSEQVAKAFANTPGTDPSMVPASAPPTTAPSAATTGAFIIQVASYRGQAEAEKQKAALALAGLESRIEKVTIDNRDTYYRVRIGPLRDENQARSTLAQLESSGIKAIMVKVN